MSPSVPYMGRPSTAAHSAAKPCVGSKQPSALLFASVAYPLQDRSLFVYQADALGDRDLTLVINCSVQPQSLPRQERSPRPVDITKDWAQPRRTRQRWRALKPSQL